MGKILSLLPFHYDVGELDYEPDIAEYEERKARLAPAVRTSTDGCQN